MRVQLANFLDWAGTALGAFGWHLKELANKIDPIEVTITDLDSTDVKHLLWEGPDE